MDILIPLGKGSRWENNELRYCLRSIEKHLKGIRNIYIIGECPAWLTGVISVDCKDEYGQRERDFNIYKKISVGCYLHDLSDDFLFMNDDHFLLSEVTASEFPYYKSADIIGEARSLHEGIPYFKVLINTYAFLNARKLSMSNFDVHCPIIYNKQKFLSTFPEKWPSYGFALKSMYCNTNSIIGEEYPDLKFRQPLMKESIYQALEGRTWFSIGDRCLKGDIKEVLQELYPLKSKYEL